MIKRKTFLQLLQAIFFLSIGFFLIFLFWNRLTIAEQEKVIENFFSANLWWIFLAMILGILSHLLRAMRWNLLMETLEYRVRLHESFWAVMAGYFFNLAIPRLGELMRCVFLARKKRQPLDGILGTMISERAFDLIWYALLFLISLLFFIHIISNYLVFYGSKFIISLQKNWKLWLIGSLVLMILVGLFVSYLRKKKPQLWQKVKNFLNNTWKGIVSIFKIKKWYLFFFYSLAIWILYWLMIYVVYFSLPSTSQLPPDSALVVLMFATIGIMVVQGGIGIYPLIVAEILALYGLPLSEGYALGWLTWSAQTLVVIITGIISMIYFSFSSRYEFKSSHTA
ncbi:MAG: flippase-like domain-containing protein [Bacteroidales bacterium]|nr:flippase-like domain-containing protein [Bacteroidales bacterium]